MKINKNNSNESIGTLINNFEKSLTDDDVVNQVPFTFKFLAKTPEPRIACKKNNFHSVAHYSSHLNTYFSADVATLFNSRKELLSIFRFIYDFKKESEKEIINHNSLFFHLLENLSSKIFDFNLDTDKPENNFKHVDISADEKTCYGYDFFCHKLSFIDNDQYSIQLADDLIYTSQLFELFLIMIKDNQFFKTDIRDFKIISDSNHQFILKELFSRINIFLYKFNSTLKNFNEENKDQK